MNQTQKNRPWKTIETYWSTHNGEKLSRKEAKKHYNVKLNRTLKYGKEWNNIKEKEYYCTKQQLRLF